MYSKNSKLLKLSLSSDEKYRLFQPLNEISEPFKTNILRHEDRYFYWHLGVNPYALIRASYLTFFKGQRSGASTITMQLVRSRFGINSRSVLGKLKQILSALLVELVYTKEEILEAYLNLIPFGGNIEGIGAASLIYLGKDASQISFLEGVLLAVIPESPYLRDPLKNTERLQQAASNLLLNLNKPELILELKKIVLSGKKQELPNIATHYVNRVLEKHFSQSKIKTSIDEKIQVSFEKQIRNFVDKNNIIGIQNAAAILLDCNTLKYTAYIGSADFWNSKIQGQVDGVKARRSPGSVLKPFLYALAIDQGFIHPGSILKDINFSKAAYNPENFEKDFVGPISASDALVRSRNMPAVILLNQLGPERYLDFLRSAGIEKLKEPEFYGLSLALGGVEVRMDEVAAMYCMLNNNGKFSNIELGDQDQDKKYTNLLSTQAAWLTKEMLKTNEPPLSVSNSQAKIRQLNIPWKTGTSFGFRDAWSAGIVNNQALVVWLGNFDGTSNPVLIGRDTAAVLFFRLIENLASYSEFRSNNSIPEHIKKIKVCAASGNLPGPYCNAFKDSWFIPGKSPIGTCSVHRALRVDPESGLALCKSSNKVGVEKIYEFWPSDILDVYQSSGIKFSKPPENAPECLGVNLQHQQPLITSPQEKIVYQLENTRLDIPFSAVTDADTYQLTWFIDDQILASVKNNETYYWRAKPGKYIVRVVDNHGSSNSVLLNILDN